MNTEYIIIGVNLVLFLVAPYLPTVVYTHIVETYIGITILLLAALYSVTHGYLASVSAFIGIASLYSESHARKTLKIKGNQNVTGKNEFENQIKPSPDLVPNELHPEIETPDNELIKSIPDKNDGENLFEPVDTSINDKTNLPTISNTKDAEELYLKDNLSEAELKE